MRPLLATAALLLTATPALAQVDQGQDGAWYTYAWTHRFANSNFGWQGDVQEVNGLAWRLGVQDKVRLGFQAPTDWADWHEGGFA